MNQQNLDDLVTQAIDRIAAETGQSLDRDALLQGVLQDPDIRLLLHGYEMHDRSEGLENVIIRDISIRVDAEARAANIALPTALFGNVKVA